MKASERDSPSRSINSLREIKSWSYHLRYKLKISKKKFSNSENSFKLLMNRRIELLKTSRILILKSFE